MQGTITVQVPAGEAEALEALIRDLSVDAEAELIESRAFDGGLIIMAVVSIATATLPVLKAWLLARSQERRSTKVTIEGKQFQAYSADEVIAILEAVKDSTVGGEKRSQR